MPRVTLSPIAKLDVRTIGAYIAKESGSRAIARQFLEKLTSAYHLLAAHPEMGELRPEFADGRYRSFSVGNYVIYYAPARGGIHIARVLHGARDHGHLL